MKKLVLYRQRQMELMAASIAFAASATDITTNSADEIINLRKAAIEYNVALMALNLP